MLSYKFSGTVLVRGVRRLLIKKTCYGLSFVCIVFCDETGCEIQLLRLDTSLCAFCQF